MIYVDQAHAGRRTFLRTHGRGVFGELMRMRGLPVERFPRWECAPFTEKDRAELKEGIAKAGFKA